MKSLVTLLSGIAIAGSAAAQTDAPFFENVETNLQYATALSSSQDKALGYGADSNKLETLRFTHENRWKYGNSSFLLDYLSSDKPLGGPTFGPNNPSAFAYGDGNNTYFFVGEVELTSSKVLGWKPAEGSFVKDVGLSYRYEDGGYYKFRANELGPRVHLNVPGFDTFKLAAWYRQKSDISGSAGQSGFDVGTRRDYQGHWLLGMDWKTSWQMLGYTWTSQAYIRYQVGRGGKAGASGTDNINGVPDRLWVEPDVFVNLTRNFAIGARYYYLWQSDAIDNGYSTKGNNDHAIPQIVVKAFF
jgi:hypothetical protein